MPVKILMYKGYVIELHRTKKERIYVVRMDNTQFKNIHSAMAWIEYLCR